MSIFGPMHARVAGLEDTPAATVSDQALSTAQLYFSEMLSSASPLAYTQQLLRSTGTSHPWHGSQHNASLCLKADPWSRHAHCICDSLLLIWPEHIGDVCAIARACWQPGHLMGGCAAHAPYCRQAFQCTQMSTNTNSCRIWMWKREM